MSLLSALLPNVSGTDEQSADRAVPSTAETHRSLVGPAWLEEQPGELGTGGGWLQSRWIAAYPELPVDGLLEGLYAAQAMQDTDVSIHVRPRDTEATLDALENRIESLEADADYLAEKRRAGVRGVEKDLQDYQALYDSLRNTSTGVFETSMFLSSHVDAGAETGGVARTARQQPTNLTPIRPRWSQTAAAISGSPVGVDRLSETYDTSVPMLSDALGAMFPFVAGSFAEPGIEYGRDALTGRPVTMDRFERETGYCMLTLGKLGSGKSFGTKLQVLRRAMRDDTMIVLLDPLDGFASVNEALGGERITVGGTQGLNPLALEPTPPAVLEGTPDLDPWSEQIANVMAFFSLFFERVANHPLGKRTQTLRRCVQAAYRRQGIERDPETHDNPSPTVRTVIEVLEELCESPAQFGYELPDEQDAVRETARDLLLDLRPSFEADGDLQNLARETAFDLDAQVLYLDLYQTEGGRSQAQTSLMMHALFNTVFERAKVVDREVLFVIDEAHYLLGEASTASALETAVRHSRHHNLSLHFVTQTSGEFTLTPEARTIAELCSIVQIHRISEAAEELASWCGLNDREIEWIQTAQAGDDELGYSEALLCLDGDANVPIRIHASPAEVDHLT